ncbi:TetR/AcrR family transcriptional regulator [Nocardia sp. SYP-A9097]|uniref:TetR/AcrR family transcriptional regulator n=1 Tax=Nocardia sp. SYP-A9097 TaxID=2663237 RepID=UPI0018912361|nr:TetR/AcrR family transcriptional regulator [Nocardia sp. SYP-A9097]
MSTDDDTPPGPTPVTRAEGRGRSARTAPPATADSGNAVLAGALAGFERSRHRFPEGQRRIFLAAIDAFAERGFRATTTRDIAARAGLSPAGLYVHFGSKEEVLHRISLSAMQLTKQVAETAAGTRGTPTARLAATVRDLTAWHAEHSASVRVVLYHLTDLTPEHHTEVLDVQLAIHRLIRDLVGEGVTAGEFDVPDPGVTTLALLSLCVDTARWYRPDYRRTPPQLGRDYAALALRMVGARID